MDNSNSSVEREPHSHRHAEARRQNKGTTLHDKHLFGDCNIPIQTVHDNYNGINSTAWLRGHNPKHVPQQTHPIEQHNDNTLYKAGPCMCPMQYRSQVNGPWDLSLMDATLVVDGNMVTVAVPICQLQCQLQLLKLALWPA